MRSHLGGPAHLHINSLLERKNLATIIKDALSGLKQFLATESPLKMMKNAFYVTSKALFVLKIFKCLSWLFGHGAKRLHEKYNFNFEFYDVTPWLTNNCNTHTVQYLMRNIFLEKSSTKCGGKTSPRPSSEKLKMTISLDQWSVSCSLFLLYGKLRAIEIYWN